MKARVTLPPLVDPLPVPEARELPDDEARASLLADFDTLTTEPAALDEATQ